MPCLHLRPATEADADTISRLIQELSGSFTLDAQGKGAEKFFTTISPEAIAGYLADPRYRYRVAESLPDGDLVGVVAMRDGRHLFHLFVCASWQRRGIARSLWRDVLAECLGGGRLEGGIRVEAWEAGEEPVSITVNASQGALLFYQRLGFQSTGPLVETQGIAYIPMVFEFSGQSFGQ